MISDQSPGWCILRTAPSHTLQLAAALADAGFEVWTPAETVKPSPPKASEPWDRRCARPRRKSPDMVTRPMLPSFVFARADRRADLAALSHAPDLTYQVWDANLRRMVTRGRPFFRLFQGDARPIPDEALAPLRRIEGRRWRKPRGLVPDFEPGDRVRLIEGAYEGLRGVVVAISKKTATVRFAGGMFEPIVFTWLLIPDLDAREEQRQNSAQLERHALKSAA